jgi:hypothetical protein
MSQDWSKKEVELIVKDYFEMLEEELRQSPFNKTAHRKALLPLLNHRNSGSVEFKHQNISAVLVENGLPFIKGYKPLGNYQSILEDQVIKALRGLEPELMPLFEKFSDLTVPAPSVSATDFKTCLEKGPVSSPEPKRRKPSYRTSFVNYLEKEQNNRALGFGGEQFVLEYEEWRLKRVGRSDLVGKIEWISRDKGDGAGFDILSRNEDDSERFVEVKTTKLPKEAPIFVSANEVSFAASHAENFYLYRVFNYGPDKKLFIRQGNYKDFCFLRPVGFKGMF